MKKVLFALLIGLVSLTACKPTAEGYINNLNDLIEKVVEEGSEYTEEQWEKISKDFEELVKKAEELEGLTEEQKKEISKLQGKFKGVVLKSGLNHIIDDTTIKLEKAGETIKGFFEGLDKDE